ncbi:MAG: Dabb family protein [Saccharospirillaceae bacterium]|nr:Dabb family protein [Pseudomonadales bacterium]NRB79054.1 Dabb family protein [Saccharospirillaceae bacterium]
MIKRISLFKLKRPQSDDLETAATALRSMKGTISSLLDIEVGVNFSQSPAAYDLVLNMTFKDVAALRQFEQDPFHLSVKKTMIELKENRVVVDYQSE